MSFSAMNTARQLSLLLLNDLTDDARQIYRGLSRAQRVAVDELLGPQLVTGVRRQLGLGER